MFVCGQNHRGQLGLGHLVEISTLQRCSSLTQTVTNVTCGWDFTLFLTGEHHDTNPTPSRCLCTFSSVSELNAISCWVILASAHTLCTNSIILLRNLNVISLSHSQTLVGFCHVAPMHLDNSESARSRLTLQLFRSWR